MTAALPNRPDRPRRPVARPWVKAVANPPAESGIDRREGTEPAEPGAMRAVPLGVARPVAEPGLAEQLACVRAVRELLAGIDGRGDDATDSLRIDLLTATEELKGAITAAQARVTVAFGESQHAAGEAAGRGAREVDRGIGPQLALARRCSASTADRHRSLAAALTTVLPHTLAALTTGTISEAHAQAMQTATTGLSAEVRMVIDSRLAGRLPILTPKQLGAAATHLAAELDVEALVARHRLAVTNRGAWTRPAPDGMAYLTVLGPLPEIVGAVAALHAHATAVVAGHAQDDPAEDRTHAQVMADTALTRLSGRATGQSQPVAITLVMTPDNLYGHHTNPYAAADGANPTAGAGTVDAGRRLALVRDPAPDGGTTDDGMTDGGTIDDGTTDDCTNDDGTTDDGPSNVCTTDDGPSNVCTTDDGPSNVCTTDDGTSNVCTTDDSTSNVCTTDDSTSNVCTTEDRTPDDYATDRSTETNSPAGATAAPGTDWAHPGDANSDPDTEVPDTEVPDTGKGEDAATTDGAAAADEKKKADESDKRHLPGTRARCAPTATPVRIVGHGPIAAPLARAWLLSGCDTPENDKAGGDEHLDGPPPDHTDLPHQDPIPSSQAEPADRIGDPPPDSTTLSHPDAKLSRRGGPADRSWGRPPRHSDWPAADATLSRPVRSSDRGDEPGDEPGPGQHADGSTPAISTAARHRGTSNRAEEPGDEPGPGQHPDGSTASITTAARHRGTSNRAEEPRPDEQVDSSCAAPTSTATRHPAEVWLRRAFTGADGRDLIALESTARLFPPQLRALLVLRDDVCRLPFCDAPIRHADHIVPASTGGPTTLNNGQGLSARCNYTKDLAGFSSRTLGPAALADLAAGPDTDRNTTIARKAGPDTHVTAVTTPTGHMYLSANPPVLGWATHGEPDRHRR